MKQVGKFRGALELCYWFIYTRLNLIYLGARNDEIKRKDLGTT